jgi:hypothetical protein
MRNEPLIEIKQIKGQSETHPLLSPNDEFANFEILTYLLGNPEGRIPHVIGSYARQALKDGLALEDTKGFNPYRFGFGAASDSHDTGVAYRQDNFFGGHGIADGTIETRMFWTSVRRSRCAHGRPRRSDRRLGGREHARVDLQRHEAQGDLCG